MFVLRNKIYVVLKQKFHIPWKSLDHGVFDKYSLNILYHGFQLPHQKRESHKKLRESK